MIDPTASIDDLLQHEEEAPAKATRRSSAAGWWVRTGLIAAALTAVTVFGLRLFGVAVSVPAILAGYLALLALRRVTAQVAPPPPPRRHAYRDTGDDDGMYHWGERDALRSAVHRWELALGRADGDRGRFAQAVLPAIGELVDERLRQRYGLTRDSDPDRARALLGDPLWNFLTAPARRSPQPRDCAAIIAQLEKL
jgi:hypothetical protein